MNHSCELMAKNSTLRKRWAIPIATPYVKVRSTHDGVRVFDQNSTRFDFWCGKGFQLERFTRLGENSG
jgi:hypothetical protein